jgi:DNA-binding Xre family transcriptional regulator
MLWQEILIDRPLTSEAITIALSELFNLPANVIAVVEDIATSESDDRIQVICEKQQIKGEFIEKLSLYLLKAKLADNIDLQDLEKLCQLLHCNCLISDDSLNPFSMILVEASGKNQIIFLDIERLENDEEYTIDWSLERKKLAIAL